MDWSRRHGNQYGRNRLYWSDGLDRLDWPRGHGDKYGCHRFYWLDWMDRTYGLYGLDRLDWPYGNSREYGRDGTHRTHRYFRAHGSSRTHWC